MVPSADREGRLEEACLYGNEYYALEDGVVDVMRGGQADAAQPRDSASRSTA
jgi:hypothetical protein